jgi:hypothetical protein
LSYSARLEILAKLQKPSARSVINLQKSQKFQENRGKIVRQPAGHSLRSEAASSMAWHMPLLARFADGYWSRTSVRFENEGERLSAQNQTVKMLTVGPVF